MAVGIRYGVWVTFYVLLASSILATDFTPGLLVKSEPVPAAYLSDVFSP